MNRCERCESPVDQERPGYVTRSGRTVHAKCPDFEGEWVDVGPALEVFEVGGVPRIVYTDKGATWPFSTDLQDLVEDHYDRPVSFGSWVETVATWVVPSPSKFNGKVWVCRTDGWGLGKLEE